MGKANLELFKQVMSSTTREQHNLDDRSHRSPLANLVWTHLDSLGLRQVDFCRKTGFDQGLLSKILSGVVNSLNVETALKLAEGLNIPPVAVFEVIGKKDVDELLRRFYSKTGPMV
jgi:hypothetical protein